MKSEQRDPFQCLGVPSTASAAEVKQAYRRLVSAWHPDRYAQDSVQQRLAQERLKDINAAYADCLNRIALRRTCVKDAPVFTPPRKKTTSPPAAKSDWTESKSAHSVTPPLAMWPNMALACLLTAGWMIGLRRYGLGARFLQFVGLLAIVPSIAALWYNARLLRGRLMLILYVVAVAGAGLFLLLSQALYEQQLMVTVPSWQGGGEAVRGFGPVRGVGSGDFSIAPPAAVERGFGPAPPLVTDPSTPLAPMAPLAPEAPIAPRAK